MGVGEQSASTALIILPIDNFSYLFILFELTLQMNPFFIKILVHLF